MYNYIVARLSFLYHWIRYVLIGTKKHFLNIFVSNYDIRFWIRAGARNTLVSSFILSMFLLFLPFVYMIGYYRDTLNGVIWGIDEPPEHGDYQRRVWSGMWITIALLLYFLFWTALPSILLTFIGQRVGIIAFTLSLVLMVYFFPALWVAFNHSNKFREEEAITMNRLLWNRTYIKQYPRIFTSVMFGFLLSAVSMILISTVFVYTPLTIEQSRYLILFLSFPVSHIATIQILYAFGKATRNTLLEQRDSYYTNDTQPEWMESK